MRRFADDEAIGMSAVVIIRSFEPSDADMIPRLFGSDGVFEGTLYSRAKPMTLSVSLFLQP
jgi:hypothetical protein